MGTERDRRSAAVLRVSTRGAAAVAAKGHGPEEQEEEEATAQAGNLASARDLARFAVRPKLSVSQPGDPEEEEADRVANAVVSRTGTPPVQRKCACSGGTPCAACEEEKVHAKRAGAAAGVPAQASVGRAVAAVQSGGSPLPRDVRSTYEHRLGTDLSGVRVHTDVAAGSAARAIGARAFTVDNAIAFAPGEFRPGDTEGQFLLAHELTHTIQHGAASARVRRDPTPPAAKVDEGGVKQSVDIIMKALRGITTAGDSASILGQFRKKDPGTVSAIMQGIKGHGGDSGKTADEMIDWLFEDMTAEDSRELRRLLISVGVIDDVGRIVASMVKKQLEKWFTSGEEILNALLQFDGVQLDAVLGKVQASMGLAADVMAVKLFDSVDRVSAERLRQHAFSKGGPTSLALAATWTAAKIAALLEGYVSHADSSQVVWNFTTTLQEYRPVVQQRLDVLMQKAFNLSAGDALMKFLDESDYKALKNLKGLTLADWVDKRGGIRKAVGVAEWLVVFTEWVACGAIGIVTGVLAAVWDIISGLWDIVLAANHLLWSLLYLLSGGSVGSENWLAVKDFFSGLKALGSPGKVWTNYWDGLKTEFATIEGPLADCRVAELAVRKFIVAVVNILLVFVAGYGLVKAGVKAVQTIAELVALAREFGILEALVEAGSRLGKGAKALVIVSVEDATKLASMLLNPIDTLIAARREINLILLAAREEGVWAFMRAQGAEVTAAERKYWQEQKELWRTTGERVSQRHSKVAGDAEGFKGLLDEEKRAPENPEGEAKRIQDEAKSVKDDADALNDEVVGKDKPSTSRIEEIQKETPLLEEELRKPGGAKRVTDPEYLDQYDVEAQVGDHTYRRRADGTWCRFSDVDCGLKMGNATAEADKALAGAKTTVHEWPPKALKWPPEMPAGDPPAFNDPRAATWRYEYYRYKASLEGRKPAIDPANPAKNEILPPDVWKERYFDTVLEGGRPGRGGSKAHKDDVLANNEAGDNKLVPQSLSNGRVPDGVGRPGQEVIIRGQKIKPVGQGRVLVESDHVIAGGTMPDSAARDQVRAFRAAEPDATIVVTDLADPTTPPLIYPPGTQPPPPGRLPVGQPPIVKFP